jgi:hypothetical protein
MEVAYNAAAGDVKELLPMLVRWRSDRTSMPNAGSAARR